MTALDVAPVLYQTMPPLAPEEYQNLEQSIRDHGIQVPILVDEDGVIIDGHHRQKIAQTLGVPCPVEVKFDLSDDEKRALSISLNIDRRQLSREQRRAIIEASLRGAPELSDREHAKRTGVSHPTVAAVRRDLEGNGDVESLSTRVDSAGRQQPASKPPREPDANEYVNHATGEVTDEPVEVTETHTVKTVSKPVVLTGDAAARKNDEDLCFAFGRSLVNLEGITYPEHRAWILRAWPTASDAATPDARDLATPHSLRAIAVALNQLADEWENTNG